MTKRRASHLHPLFRTDWYERGAVRTPAYLRQLLDARAALSRGHLRQLLEYQVAFPREYRIPPAYWQFAYDIAQSKLPSDDWLHRHPKEARIIQESLDQHWDETGEKLRRKGMHIISSPDVLRARQKRRATGCPTKGHDPSRLLRDYGVPARLVQNHLRSLPQWLAEEGAHVTGWGTRREIITFCRGVRIETMVQED